MSYRALGIVEIVKVGTIKHLAAAITIRLFFPFTDFFLTLFKFISIKQLS